MDYCQQCNGKKEMTGLGLGTLICPICLGSGVKKAFETLFDTESKKSRNKMKKINQAPLNEHINEGINPERKPILPSISSSTE